MRRDVTVSCAFQQEVYGLARVQGKSGEHSTLAIVFDGHGAGQAEAEGFAIEDGSFFCKVSV